MNQPSSDKSKLDLPVSLRYKETKREKTGVFFKKKVGWLFVIVSVIAITIFNFYPMVQAFLLSFQSGMGGNLEYTGLDNWQRLFSDPTFIAALTNTSIYLLIQVPLMIVLALIFSVLLNDPKLKFRGFFRIAIFLPCVTSLVAYSVIFK